MKTKHLFKVLFIITLTINCSCKKDNDMIPDPILTNSYEGNLIVRTVNSYPEWDETAQVDVNIDKETGLVTFSNTILTYSGETIIDDSKIERNGSWEIIPTGLLKEDNETVYIEVDAGVIVINDTQKIYAKNNLGNWQLVNESNFDTQPNSDLNFVLNDAVTGGSVISADAGSASLTWTLLLSVALDSN